MKIDRGASEMPLEHLEDLLVHRSWAVCANDRVTRSIEVPDDCLGRDAMKRSLSYLCNDVLD